MDCVYFPETDAFPELHPDPQPSVSLPPLSHWIQVKVGTLRYRVDVVVQRQTMKTRRHVSPAAISASVFVRFANEVFGFDGWSTSVVACDVVSESTDPVTHTYSARCRAKVRLELHHGDYALEAEGEGTGFNLPLRSVCLNKCRKEAVTSATKQCLLDLCSYVIEDDVARVKQEYE